MVVRDSSVGIANRYVLDGPGIESHWRRGFAHQSKPVLGPTQHPIQWVPCLYRGKSGQGVALTNHPHLAPRLKTVELCRSHPVVLSIQLVKYLFTSYTTINIKIHTIKCYKFLVATCFGRPCYHHQANFNRSCASMILVILVHI